MLLVLTLTGCLLSGKGFDEKLVALAMSIPPSVAVVPAVVTCADGHPPSQGLRDRDGDSDLDGLGAGSVVQWRGTPAGFADAAGDLPHPLATGSPAIDTGNPETFDLDGSRSDRGFYGGPFAS